MGKGETVKSSHHSREKDSERKHKKRRKDDDNDEGSRKTKHRKKDSGRKLKIVDDNPDDEDMWVEKNIDMDGERVSQVPNFVLVVVQNISTGPCDKHSNH